jgi:adenosylmethionine-8-amino-7-oxononanoate aminotransferase
MAPSAVHTAVQVDEIIKPLEKALNGHNSSTPSSLLHRNLHETPLKVIASKGNYLTLSNGQKIFDATGGAAVAGIGHGNAEVKAAMIKQMDEVSYCHSLFFTSSGAEDLANFLVESTHGHMARAFILCSGEIQITTY